MSGNGEFTGQVFGATLSLLGIFIAVIGIFLGLYDGAQGNAQLVDAIRCLIYGATTVTILDGIVAALALLKLKGWVNVPESLIGGLLLAIIASVCVGVLFIVSIQV